MGKKGSRTIIPGTGLETTDISAGRRSIGNHRGHFCYNVKVMIPCILALAVAAASPSPRTDVLEARDPAGDQECVFHADCPYPGGDLTGVIDALVAHDQAARLAEMEA